MRMTVTLQTNLKADNIVPEFENMYFCDEFGAKKQRQHIFATTSRLCRGIACNTKTALCCKFGIWNSEITWLGLMLMASMQWCCLGQILSKSRERLRTICLLTAAAMLRKGNSVKMHFYVTLRTQQKKQAQKELDM